MAASLSNLEASVSLLQVTVSSLEGTAAQVLGVLTGGSGGPTQAQIDAVQTAVDDAKGPEVCT